MPDCPPKIGKYEIVSELGRGAMGVVYKGLDPVINRFVAIKTLARRGSEAETAQLADRFKREAQAAGRLNHPNIVSVYEYGEDQEQAFIAMEFVDGYTLVDLVKRNSVLELNDIWDLLLKVLDALHYAHSKGIVHRDIKPSNIMCTTSGEVKIADFGIARIESSELTQVGTVIGTPGYMSPEQLLGHRIDHRSDIFSCGILLYELLTGERAFASSNITSTIYKVVHTELPAASKLCPTVPEAIDPVLARALAKNPNDRFPSAKELADAIRRVSLGTPLTVQAADAEAVADDKTIVIKAPQPHNDERTIVVPSAPAEDWINKLGSEAPSAPVTALNAAIEQDRASAGATARSRTVRKGLPTILAGVGVAVIIGAGLAFYLLKSKHDDSAVQVATPQPTVPTQTDVDPAPAAEVHTPTATPPAHTPGTTFKDCENCPAMVVVPSGSFVQGSPATESEREPNEGPQQDVALGYPLAVGRYEITRGEFARFAAETGYTAAGCWTYDGDWKQRDAADWRSPGFPQDDSHPVVCVSEVDAKAYIDWLNSITGQEYRLLSSSEWEYVARAGTQSARSWGDDLPTTCAAANVADRTAETQYPGWNVHGCADGYVHTAPVGSFQANAFGVYDMSGNTFEWVADCWNQSYQGAPADGTAWMRGDCGQRVLRGASWFSMPRYVRTAYRAHFERNHRSSTFGFRVARGR